MSAEPERSSSPNRTVIIIVAIIAVTLLLIVAICTGAVFLLVRMVGPAMTSAMQMAGDIQISQLVAEGFMDDLGAGQLDEAYEATSKGFRSRQSLEAFRAFVDKHPTLTNQTASFINPQQVMPAQWTIQVTVTDPKGSVTCTLTVVKEAEEFKVDRFTIP